MTRSVQRRFAMQTVVAPLLLQRQDRGAVSDAMRQRWSRLEPDRIELPGTPTAARALDRETDVRGHATASETCSGYTHATALANGLQACNPPIHLAGMTAPPPYPGSGPRSHSD
jgi:hypothetical protein